MLCDVVGPALGKDVGKQVLIRRAGQGGVSMEMLFHDLFGENNKARGACSMDGVE